jgi:glycosyltransferase involved in cell wall biosynthesis
MVFTAFSFGWLLIWHFNAFSLVIVLFGIYRIISLLRIIEKRIHYSALRKVIFRSSGTLICLQLLTVAVWMVFHKFGSDMQHGQLVAFSQAVIAAAICIFTVKNVVKLHFSWPQQHYSDKELPTITVAIPARNETQALANCLDTVVGSDYPKLEILVLDDCSQDRTSDIIKRYAQSGVRFLHGNEPKPHWLAKNQAYDELARAASGDYILFLGVDTRLGIKTIRSLVTMALAKNKQMISVLPLRSRNTFGTSFIQPMRYWWELALPRKLFNRPPVLSTCWLVKRAVVTGNGGFSAVSQSILPEAFFAKKLIAANTYSFVRSSSDLVVLSHKNFHDQLDRTLRVRYPELHRKLELTALLTVLELIFLLAPFGLLITTLLHIITGVLPIIIVTCLLLVIAHLIILAAVAQPLTLASLINFPVVVVVEVLLGNLSMLRYEFSTVDWKGRNICIPVMLPPVQVSPQVSDHSNLG